MDKNKLVEIANNLTLRHDRTRDRELLKAQAEIEAIGREHAAYCQGVADMLNDVHVALMKEGARKTT